MDFIDWCGLVLNKLIEVGQMPPNGWYGVNVETLARALFSENAASVQQLSGSRWGRGLADAIKELKNVGLIAQKDRPGGFMTVTRLGRERASDMTPLWKEICQTRLDPEEEQVLRLANQLSQYSGDDYALLEWVNYETLASQLGWADGIDSLERLAQQLEQIDLIRCSPYIRHPPELRATYRGLVWETRRSFTSESKRIDALVAEWETTSVEFKRELYLDTADQRAELVKDILGLVNTQASGQRLLIIGFDNKTHEYYAPPDSRLTQDRIEHILSRYTKPIVNIRYKIIDYRSGSVGQIEVLREPRKLPYRVAQSIGDKKRILEDQIFVRHGSQTEEPIPAELQALLEEGERARAASRD